MLARVRPTGRQIRRSRDRRRVYWDTKDRTPAVEIADQGRLPDRQLWRAPNVAGEGLRAVATLAAWTLETPDADCEECGT